MHTGNDLLRTRLDAAVPLTGHVGVEVVRLDETPVPDSAELTSHTGSQRARCTVEQAAAGGVVVGVVADLLDLMAPSCAKPRSAILRSRAGRSRRRPSSFLPPPLCAPGSSAKEERRPVSSRHR